jgi:hypothetical protein
MKIFGRRRSRLACLTAPPLSGGAVAQDAPKTDTFGRWSVIVDDINTGQDVRKTCVASTAFRNAIGDSGTLTLAISNGDALPPVAYPAMTIAIDNKDLPTGKNIAASFGDVGGKVAVTIDSSAAVNGRLGWTVNNQAKTSLALCAHCRARQLKSLSPTASCHDFDGRLQRPIAASVYHGFPTTDVAPEEPSAVRGGNLLLPRYLCGARAVLMLPSSQKLAFRPTESSRRLSSAVLLPVRRYAG